MDTAQLLLLIVPSGALSVCYLWAHALRRGAQNKQEAWLTFGFLMLCPVLGWAFVALSMLLRMLPGNDPKTLAYRKEDAAAPELLLPPDDKEELNVVSVEEALLVSDKSDLRRLLLDILKRGADESMGAVALALQSEDSEASHYSASAIADSLSRFYARAAALEKEAASGGAAEYQALFDYLTWYLSQRILPAHEQLLYLRKASEALGAACRLAPALALPGQYSLLARLAVAAGDIPLGADWARRAAAEFPESADCFDANLRVAYAQGDADAFRQWLQKLRSSNVIIGKELLDIIRAFG